jgi:hypothetical protein
MRANPAAPYKPYIESKDFKNQGLWGNCIASHVTPAHYLASTGKTVNPLWQP